MISDKIQNAVALWCHAAAIGLFETFSAKKNCGPNFTWADFPDFVADYCENMVFVNVRYPKNVKAEVEAHAADTGRKLAEKLVKCVNNLQS